MPSTNEGLLLAIGAIFLLIGLLGGGFEVSAIKIPSVGKYPRIFSVGFGIIFVVIAIARLFSLGTASLATQPTSTPVLLTPTFGLPTAIPTPSPTAIPPTAIPTPSPTAIPPTATANITPAQTPLSEGFPRLEETIYGRFDPNVPANIQLDAGRAYRFTGERSGRYCRAEFPPNGLIWVLCINIGEPEPTQIPPTRIQIPPTPSPRPKSVTSVTYRVDIVKISLDEMKTLPGCESPVAGNNACIVGPGRVNLELYNYQENAIYGPIPTDVRQLYIREERRTRITVVSDLSGLPIHTIGNNELVPELGQYYKVVIKKVE